MRKLPGVGRYFLGKRPLIKSPVKDHPAAAAAREHLPRATRRNAGEVIAAARAAQ